MLSSSTELVDISNSQYEERSKNSFELVFQDLVLSHCVRNFYNLSQKNPLFSFQDLFSINCVQEIMPYVQFSVNGEDSIDSRQYFSFQNKFSQKNFSRQILDVAIPQIKFKLKAELVSILMALSSNLQRDLETIQSMNEYLQEQILQQEKKEKIEMKKLDQCQQCDESFSEEEVGAPRRLQRGAPRAF